MALLEISGLTVTFGKETAVRDISMHVEKGEIVGMVGESGAGKSTIGAAVTDLLEPPGQITAGNIRLNGKTLPLGNRSAMRKIRGKQIGAIFQDPLTSLDPLFTVADQLSETLRTHRPELSRSHARAEAVALLHEVGMENAEARANDYPHQFSGGMRQRVVIALALAGNPQLLLADEPTTALDVSLQARILKLIRREAVTRGIGVILITHDMGVVAETADRIEIMRHGGIVESGPVGEVLQNPRHAYSKMLLASVPPTDRKLHRFYLPDMPDNNSAPPLSTTPSTLPQSCLLEISEIHKTFGGKTAVEDVSFSIMAGESLGLVGESGSGKTTINRIIAGLTIPDSGRIVFAGRDFSGHKQTRHGMQMVFQDPYSSLNPRLRTGFAVAEPLLVPSRNTKRKEAEARAQEMLALVGLPPDAAQKWPHQFSGGQRQRIAIARALITSPRLLLCDEPTSALDVSIQAQILNLIKDLQEKLGLALLFISHDLPVVRQMCDRIGVLKSGQLIEIRPTEDLFKSPQTKYAAELLKLVPRISPHPPLNTD